MCLSLFQYTRSVYQRATGQRASVQRENCLLLIFQVLEWYLMFPMHCAVY